MTPKKLPPVHPGEILLEEFLEPMGISQYRLAKDISVPPRSAHFTTPRKVMPLAVNRSAWNSMAWTLGKDRLDVDKKR